MLIYPLLVAVWIVLGWLCTLLAVRYARSRQLIDAPGLRRSHVLPTPRGGGLGFVLPVLLLSIGLAVWFTQYRALFLAVLGAGGLLALVGFLDDHHDQPALRRLLLQAVAAVVFLGLAGWPVTFDLTPLAIDFATGGTMAALAAGLLALLGLIWMVNLTNFMDGSNGLVAVQAVFAAGVIGTLNAIAGETDLALLALGFAAATLGYLPWNFPRARVFMGDVGSYFAGFMLAVLLLESQRRQSVSLALSLLAMAPMVLDASLTLLKRAIKGRRLTRPHREHLYQMLLREGWSHTRVTLMLAAALMGLVLPLVISGYYWAFGQGWLLLLFSLGFATFWQTRRIQFRTRQQTRRRGGRVL